MKGVQLKKLALAGCAITDLGIEVILKVGMVARVGLEAALSSTPSNLLLLTTCQALCKNMNDLEVIDVSKCAALTQRAIRAISLYCRGLNTLRMSGCPEVPQTTAPFSRFEVRTEA